MNNKLALILVFTIFFIPVLLSVLLHSEWLEWRGSSTRNHGQLIEPVQPLGSFERVTADARTASEADLEGRWQLAYVAPGGCEETCFERLYWMRQVRLAQDRHQADVGLLVLTDRELATAEVDRILELAPDFLAFDRTAGAELSGRFPDPGAGSFYILDPMANIILRYDGGDDPNHIRRDLRRLLTWTR